jgi:hypothetical protein
MIDGRILLPFGGWRMVTQPSAAIEDEATALGIQPGLGLQAPLEL